MQKKDLRIIFMGTQNFALCTLKRLIDNNYNVVAVVTQPNIQSRRHSSEYIIPEIAKYAQEHNIPTLQPSKMKDEEFITSLHSFNADLQVVVCFRMLPEVVWAMPRFGTFNVHAALLPQYRGAAPINWAIINGEKQTGVTTFFLDHNIDTGKIIMQKTFGIPNDADAEYVYNGLMHLGAEVTTETIDKFISNNGKVDTISQNSIIKEGETLHDAPKIFKGNCEINWNKSIDDIYNFIRGLSPMIGAHGIIILPNNKETEIKIYKAEKTDKIVINTKCGTLIRDKKHMYIVCGNGNLLEIISLQPLGKKRIDASAYLNGLH